ncbi:MAG: hypothetical protein IJ287_06350 [Methanobrevibacter sp.]|nr:hypothetical protein [Methanobrevibacter sp.]
MDTEKISQFNQIILKHANTIRQASSNVLFNTYPIDMGNIVQDLTYFNIEAEDEKGLEENLNNLIEELNQMNCDYCLVNEDTREFIEYVQFVGSVDIKFDNLTEIPKGTYKKIDELKYLKTEFGYCKGYMPTFRPLEGKPINNKEIKDEHIYVFSNSDENMAKLREVICKKIMEINADLIVEHRQFT